MDWGQAQGTNTTTDLLRCRAQQEQMGTAPPHGQVSALSLLVCAAEAPQIAPHDDRTRAGVPVAPSHHRSSLCHSLVELASPETWHDIRMGSMVVNTFAAHMLAYHQKDMAFALA